jgi:hypothetical protein
LETDSLESLQTSLRYRLSITRGIQWAHPLLEEQRLYLHLLLVTTPMLEVTLEATLQAPLEAMLEVMLETMQEQEQALLPATTSTYASSPSSRSSSNEN